MSLDVQTFQDPAVQNKLTTLRSRSTWAILPQLISSAAQLTSIFTQGIVFGYIFVGQKQSMTSLVNIALSSIPTITSFMNIWGGFLPSTSSERQFFVVFRDLCTEQHGLRLVGMKITFVWAALKNWRIVH